MAWAVLSTQALCRETDVVETMRISIQSFMPTLAAAMALAVVGCGGGSATKEVIPPSGTVVSSWNQVVDGVNSPKHLFYLGGVLYVNNYGSNQVLQLSSSGNLSVYSNVAVPIGIAAKSGTLYVSGRHPLTNLVGLIELTPLASSPKAAINANHYGIAFGNNNLYLVDGSSINIFNSSTWAAASPSSIQLGSGAPQGLLVNGNLLYVSNTNGAINVIDTDANTLVADLFTAATFDRPNAMVLDGMGNMYIANGGNGVGDGGSISKVNLSTLSTEVFVTSTQVGLCGAAGLAIVDGYIFVSNGTCSTAALQHKLLKIKL